MTPVNITYSATLMAAGVICLVVAVMVWYMGRDTAGARPLVVFLLGLSWWDITYAIFWVGIPGPTPYFWLDIILVGAFIVPTAFLIFSLSYANLQRWLSRQVILVLMIEPVATFTLLWTDPRHDLFFGGKRALNTVRIMDAGPVFWANIYYSYLLILVAVLIIVMATFRSVGIYQKQALTILAAVIVPWIVHLSFLSTGGILPDADITPFIFSVTALAIAFAIVNYRLLDITPIAHSMLIENMIEGVIVLDTNDRVVNINPNAQKAIQQPATVLIGKPASNVFSRWSGLVTVLQGVRQARVEVPLGDAHLDLRISPLHDRRNRFVGRLIVWRDVTEFKKTQSELERLARTDTLTDVINRRHFMETADAELKRAARHKHSFTLALMDIDHFKHINDTYGHPVGDRVLIEFVKRCRTSIREEDAFARFGGEEFALLMPETDLQQGFLAAERMRSLLSNAPIVLADQSVVITISMGITELAPEEDTLEKILHRADQALYAAKQSGRNRVVTWDETLMD